MLDNPLLVSVGSLIGVSGSILSYIMVNALYSPRLFHGVDSIQCVAMNRSLTNVLFGGISAPVDSETHKIEGTVTTTTVDDTADALANADSVILVYQASHKPVTAGAHALFFLGRWLWYGGGQSAVCDFGDYGYVTFERRERPRKSGTKLDEFSFKCPFLVCYPSRCWSYAGAVQRSFGRSICPIRQYVQVSTTLFGIINSMHFSCPRNG